MRCAAYQDVCQILLFLVDRSISRPLHQTHCPFCWGPMTEFGPHNQADLQASKLLFSCYSALFPDSVDSAPCRAIPRCVHVATLAFSWPRQYVEKILQVHQNYLPLVLLIHFRLLHVAFARLGFLTHPPPERLPTSPQQRPTSCVFSLQNRSLPKQ